MAILGPGVRLDDECPELVLARIRPPGVLPGRAHDADVLQPTASRRPTDAEPNGKEGPSIAAGGRRLVGPEVRDDLRRVDRGVDAENWRQR
jgi:hypothetical protein